MARYQGVDIAEHYDLIGSLGKGGFGQVHKAICKRSGLHVAIKEIVAVDDSARSEAIREAEVMMALDHPSICRLLGLYDCVDRVYLVMEHLAGGSLLHEIEKRSGIEVEFALKIAVQIASALRHAHSRGIAHRDVKPENICFADSSPRSPVVKLIDWGLAEDFHSKPGGCMHEEAGSMYYAAPEVLEAAFGMRPSGYTCACDLWSLGVVTYEMLCGQNPFWGDLDQMLGENVGFDESVWNSVSPNLKHSIGQLLRADANDRRTASLEALARDLASTDDTPDQETLQSANWPAPARTEHDLKSHSIPRQSAPQRFVTLLHGG